MNDREPPYTTWKFKSREEKHEKEESRTIDYIFYRSKQLIPIAYLDVPTKTEIGPNGLPSANYPSDHLALQSVFLIRVWSLSSNNDAFLFFSIHVCSHVGQKDQPMYSEFFFFQYTLCGNNDNRENEWEKKRRILNARYNRHKNKWWIRKLFFEELFFFKTFFRLNWLNLHHSKTKRSRNQRKDHPTSYMYVYREREIYIRSEAIWVREKIHKNDNGSARGRKQVEEVNVTGYVEQRVVRDLFLNEISAWCRRQYKCGYIERIIEPWWVHFSFHSEIDVKSEMSARRWFTLTRCIQLLWTRFIINDINITIFVTLAT